MSNSFRLLAPSVLLLVTLGSSLQASPFSSIYAFGDSLSDAGNIYTATGGTIPGAPYSNGRFTNGPVWVQDLSTSLGLGNLTASLQGGHDFAYGDAQSGTTPVHTATPIDLTGASGQIAQFAFAHPTADANALYTIWIGSNDLFSIAQNGTPAAYNADGAAVIANIDSAISSLAGEGAKNFLVLTVPDLGKVPVAAGNRLALSTLSAQFDLALVNGVPAASIPSLGSLATAKGIHLSVFDTYSLLDGIIANPSTYGFTDVTDPCVTGAIQYVGGTACAASLTDQNKYLFWDDVHPSSAGYALIAGAALATLTPEPSSLALLAAGLLGIFVKTRRHR